MNDASALAQFAEVGRDNLGRLLQQALRSANDQIVARLTSLGYRGINPSHTAVFSNLDATGTRAVTIAQRAGMTRQGISTLIRELEAAGYVIVQSDPEDGRASLVRLTSLGEQYCVDAAKVIEQAESEWALRLNDPGLQQLRRWLFLLSERAAD